jgi:Ca2+-binding RTX toxin-like protein
MLSSFPQGEARAEFPANAVGAGMTKLTLRTTLTGENAGLYGAIETLTPLSAEALAQTWVFVGTQSTGTVTRYRLSDLGPLDAPISATVTSAAPVFRVADTAVIGDDEPRLLVSAVGMAQITSFSIGSTGVLGDQTALTTPLADPVTEMEVFETAGRTFVATGTRDAPGLTIYEWTGTNQLALRAQTPDHGKVALANITELARLNVDGTELLIAGSVTDNEVSTFRIATDGTPNLIDTLGPKDGMWIGGLDGMATVTAHGESYVVVSGTTSSSLTLIRVNAIGVMFVEEHRLDTLNTRFADVDAIAAFSIDARGFVVAGGSDDGLSLFEIMPDRSLLHRDALVNAAGGALENIRALTAVTLGSEVQIVAAGQPGLTLATLDLASIGAAQLGGAASDTLTGADADDLLWGNGGHDVLSGGAGDDILAGGPGSDMLTGGAGEDVFVFGPDMEKDTITDFELGLDRLDISAWGRVYDVGALHIDERWDGAEIHFGGYSVRLTSSTGSRIAAEDLTNDSFLF